MQSMSSCRRVVQNIEASLEWPKVSANSHPGQIQYLDRTEHVVFGRAEERGTAQGSRVGKEVG